MLPRHRTSVGTKCYSSAHLCNNMSDKKMNSPSLTYAELKLPERLCRPSPIGRCDESHPICSIELTFIDRRPIRFVSRTSHKSYQVRHGRQIYRVARTHFVSIRSVIHGCPAPFQLRAGRLYLGEHFLGHF